MKTHLPLANFGTEPPAADPPEAADLATGARRVRALLDPGAACAPRRQRPSNPASEESNR
jgi:hypothetical protein